MALFCSIDIGCSSSDLAGQYAPVVAPAPTSGQGWPSARRSARLAGRPRTGARRGRTKTRIASVRRRRAAYGLASPDACSLLVPGPPMDGQLHRIRFLNPRTDEAFVRHVEAMVAAGAESAEELEARLRESYPAAVVR